MSTQQPMQQLEEANAWLSDLPALRRKLSDEGYLFFRGILDKEELRRIRADMLELASEYGYLKASAPLEEGIYSGREYPASAKFETSALYRRILDLPRFNAFGRGPVLSLLMSGLLDAELLEHRRRIGRITFPGSFRNTTPPHQDFFYIKGTPDTYTCWIPAGDCPKELGGLAVMPGTNKLGMLEHLPMQGTGGHGVPHEQCEQLGRPWLSTDYRIGDILLFHGHTLHKALDNRSKDRMRVSLEYRYQRRADQIDPGSMEFHMKGAFES